MNEPAGDAGGHAGGRAPVTFVLIVTVINMLGVGLAWPILPKLVEELSGGGVSNAALIYGIIATAYALAQFAFSPLIGALSDAWGRKPILLLSQAGLCVDYLVMSLAPNLAWLVAARILAGVLGATVTTANAYMADISTPENRSRNFGYVGAAFGVGFIAGPLIGGVLGAIDLRLPFLFAAVLIGANLVFGLVALPESLPPANRRPFGSSGVSPFGALARLVRFPMLYPLIAALLITNIAQRGLEAIWVLYTGFRFGWSVRDASFSLAFVGAMFVLAQGFMVGPAVARLGEWRAVTIGFLTSALALTAYGFATSGWMVYPLIAVQVTGNALAGPALNAICSKTVPADEQGLLQGTLSSVNSVAIIIGPLAASGVFAAVSATNPLIDVPGAWFLFSGLLFAAGSLLVRVGNRRIAVK
ncbi:MAG: TCR/Tet family MFS transporter [Rhizobiaceae bacterium]